MELEWSPWYATLRPEMSAATKKNIDAESQDVPNPNYNEVRMLIINEIARIEREKWKLA